ncbi:hypothetical protein Pla108_36390 [Botrimarina colliarenosi]|uniref:Uncharacterized protein n=1 Tax=Botrimarina colliarenosi TaxID=2528001 RepID=A0A5C6A5L3_9BACT|nr:hypothetical protein Pla108_36390 [Botrimarina colliarenosi]
MALLAHLTSLDVPSLALAFGAGVAVGVAVALTVVRRLSR